MVTVAQEVYNQFNKGDLSEFSIKIYVQISLKSKFSIRLKMLIWSSIRSFN